MLRQRHINGDPGGRARRSLLAAADIARWPFERAAWAVERTVLWPLGERLAGWNPPRRGAGAAALATIGALAVLAAVLLLPGGGGESRDRVATPTRVAIVPPAPQPKADKPKGPVLQGVAPSFDAGGTSGDSAGSGSKSADAKASEGGAGTSSGSSGSAASGSTPATSEGSPAADEAAASASSKKPVPAGPAAMKVARRFSEAFVYYEVGERRARAKTVFGETASPRLAEALSERQPRQPAEGQVPKAKVLNLVPGPRAGKAYSVSVSLLRVGLTSELRLELSKQKGQWLVTDVRG